MIMCPVPNTRKELHSHLEIKTCPKKGRAVISLKNFRPEETVLEFVGTEKKAHELLDLTHALQIGPNDFLESSGLIDDFVNHSCDPNTGIFEDPEGRVFLKALKPIRPGDEITFDYATTQSGGLSVMTCYCGSKNCRKTIGDFSDLPADLQDYYLQHGAVLNYLIPVTLSRKNLAHSNAIHQGDNLK